MPVADRVLSTAEICVITGKKPRTVRRWFKQKRLRRVKFEGVVGVWASELIAALDWQGSGSLVADHPAEADFEDDDVLDTIQNNGDADLG